MTDQTNPHQLEIQQLREMIAHNSDWLWEVDTEGRYTFCSEHIRQLLGYTPEQILGRTPFDLMPADEAARLVETFSAIVAQQKPFSGLINRNVRADGTLVLLETSGVPVFENGVFKGYRGIDRDISPAIGPLSTRVVQLEALYAAAPVALGLIDRAGLFVNANHALAELLGIDANRLPGRVAQDFLPLATADIPQAFAQLELGRTVAQSYLERDDHSYLLTVKAVHNPSGHVIGMTIALTDVTEQQRMRQALAQSNEQLAAVNARLSELVETDYLTGLPNRRRFDEMLLTHIALANREQRPLSLLMLDVDQFKAYNDHYGHHAGDDCLRRLAQVFRASLMRPGDTVCRYGGEEFSVVLPNTCADAARRIAERLRNHVIEAGLAHEYCETGHVTVSIGVATLDAFNPDVRVASQLIEAADRALYRAKNTGRNRVCPASPSMP